MTRPSILINRQGASGDVLMTSPIVRRLYQDHNGECDIDFSVWHECAPFIEKNQYIRTVHKTKPDSNMIALYDRYIDLDLVYEKNPFVHAVDAYAMHVFGHTDLDRSLELHTSAEDQAVGQQFKEIFGNNDYVVLHQRRWAWPSRNINPDMWARVVERILKETSAFVVQIGQPHEPCFTGDRLIDARGHFSIPELKEVISHGKLFMGVDSAPGHLASTTDIDMILLYTSVKEEYRRPLRSKGRFVPVVPDIDCYGCHAKNPAPCTTFICHRGDVDCVNRFDADAIAQQAINLLNTQ